ncbi:MAG: hypothetical protein HQ481_06620 [Alphaproteobacteria bacterium]|nr:hypothetical protein [Alphaproteobacteria bacterium]
MSKKKPDNPPNATPSDAQIDPDMEFQAGLLADKVMRRVMTLADAVGELDQWQAGAAAAEPPWRRVEARALIVTHMMNTLLKRGY